MLIVTKNLPGIVYLISGRTGDSNPDPSDSKSRCRFHDISDPELQQDFGVTWGPLKVSVFRQNSHDLISLERVHTLCSLFVPIFLSM